MNSIFKIPRISLSLADMVFGPWRPRMAGMAARTGAFATGPSLPVAGVNLWLRSDLGITKSGALISKWADQSGSGYDATSSGLFKPDYQTNILNGYPAVTFENSGDEYLAANTYGATLSGEAVPFSLFMVVKAANNTGNNALVEIGLSSGGAAITGFFSGGVLQLNLQDDAEFGGEFPDPLAVDSSGSFIYLSIIRSATTLSWYKNGVLIQEIDISSSGEWTFDYAWFGNSQLLMNVSLGGSIIEVAGFDSALSTTNRQLMEAYSAARYGL